jgi:hypothetical protein
MAIAGVFDIHRRQVTFDYLDTVTGQVRRGRIDPASRAALRDWLEQFTGQPDVTFAGSTKQMRRICSISLTHTRQAFARSWLLKLVKALPGIRPRWAVSLS